MTKRLATSVARVSDAATRRPPVRVRLQGIRNNVAKFHPPEREDKIWWDRLKKALGTCSSDFVHASLFQLQNAARLPGSNISTIAINSALAMIEAIAPKDELEAGLALQTACTHIAAMGVLGEFKGTFNSERRTATFASASAKLTRAFVSQVEALRRLRHGGSQLVRVEHVHVNEGGQAVIGNVSAPAGRPAGSLDDKP